MAGKVALSGALSFVSLADLFQILGGNNCTGILRLVSQYVPNPGLIYFVNGNPVNASSGSLQGIDAIYALFGWTEGEFEFNEQGVNVGHMVKQSRMEIVLDALKMVDDGVIKKVGPPSLDEVSVVENGRAKHRGEEVLQVTKGPFVDYSHVLEEEEYRDGERIVNQGGHGKWIWVVLEGTVHISKETATGPVTVARLGAGCFVGTITALSFVPYTRSATATASGDVRLGLLDTEPLSREYASLSPDFKALLLSQDGRLKKVTDRIVELFMKEDKTKGLTKGKKVILKKGSSKEGAFTIIDGETCVVGQTKKGYLALLTLGKNDVFGHVPFMDMGHEPRSALVMASKDLEVNKLDTDNLQGEYDNLSETFKNLILNTTTCVFMTTRMAYYLHEKK
jgi:CRP-like cAMP-binding protein